MRLYALLFALVTTPAVARVSEGAASREGPPRFVVVPMDEAEPAHVEATYTALEAAGATVVGRAARSGIDLPLSPALHREATLDEPRAALLAARAALRELALEAVDEHLEEALASALRLPNPAEHRDLLADVLLLRAELALARGGGDRAHADLRLLARVDERRDALHPGLFPPNVVAAYAAARAANEDATPGYLTLGGAAADPTLVLLVDGRPVPVDEARAGLALRAGPHLVTVRAEGRVSRSVVVDVTSAEALAVDARLFAPGADAARAEALSRLRALPDDDAALAQLLEGSDASAALVLARDEVFVFTPARGRVSLDDASDALALARAAIEAARAPPVAASSSSSSSSRTDRTAPPPEEESHSIPLVLGASAVLVVVALVGVGAGALAWALQPADDVAPPPGPISVTCCGPGR